MSRALAILLAAGFLFACSASPRPDAGATGAPTCALWNESCGSQACCSGSCTDGLCTCGITGASCQSGSDCCSGGCDGGSCGSAAEAGQPCQEPANCQSGLCAGGLCAADPAQDGGPPPGTATYSVRVTGLSVPAGTQVVYCTYVHLGNPAPIDVIGFQSQQSQGGHHVIVVANKTDQPDTAPWVCSQGEAIKPQNGSMIYVSQIEQDSQLFPANVGMHLPANASLMVQIHYIDATPNPLTIASTIDVLAGAPGAVTIQAAPLLFYDSTLAVPEGSSTSTSQCIMPTGPDMSFFMLAGHMHSHGTDFKLDFQDVDGGTFGIYETSAWDSPPEKWFAPPLYVQPGATFTWTCSYFNADAGTIQSPDEMCATLGLYYPAPGGSMSCFYGGSPSGSGVCGCLYGNSDGGVGF